MTTETTEELFFNPWHPNAIPPIDPGNPRMVNPTGEFGLESYLDTRYVSPDKYPTFTSKRKTTKKQEKGTKKKKLDFKGMTQTTLDCWFFKPKTPARVRFKEWVVLKEITPHMESWPTVSLKGFSDPCSAFAQKRLQIKRSMAHGHYWRRQRLTARNVESLTY